MHLGLVHLRKVLVAAAAAAAVQAVQQRLLA
jgi:hypothetical protein